MDRKFEIVRAIDDNRNRLIHREIRFIRPVTGEGAKNVRAAALSGQRWDDPFDVLFQDVNISRLEAGEAKVQATGEGVQLEDACRT